MKGCEFAIEILRDIISIHFFYSWLTLGRIFGLIIIILAIVVISNIRKGVTAISLWGFKIQPNNEVEKIQEQFDDLNENTNLKTHFLKLLNQAVLYTSEMVSLNQDDFSRKVKSFYDFYLPGITNILGKKDNTHRIAVFYEYPDKKLKILHGYGYSPQGKEKLSLCLEESKAGYCFKQQEVYHNGDLTQDSSYVRNPMSSKQYHSLICIPIMYNGETIGILNVDGLNKNSFEQDDIDYLTYMANALAIMLDKELNILKLSKAKKEEVLS